MDNGFYFGIALVLVAGCFSGIFSTPFEKNKKWAWENNWFIWSIIALIVCPAIAVSLTIPKVFEVYAANPSTTLIIAGFGVVWGIGALLFGKGINALGVSLAIPIMQGLINVIGIVAPFIIGRPSELFTPEHIHIVIGALVTLAGIILFAKAGQGKNTSSDNAKAKSFGKGLLICILAGVFGPMINFGFVVGKPLQDTAVELGANPINSANATWAVVFLAGFLVNAIQCIILLRRNRTAENYKGASCKNYLWAMLAGVIWYGSILLYGMGCNQMGGYAASVGWGIMQATAILASGVAGLLLGEWKGAPKSSLRMMACGMALLVAGMVIFSLNHGDSDKKAPVDYVDTRIGTQAWKGQSTLSGPEEPMGFVYPGVGYPNAMVQLTPQTARTDRCYFSDQPKIHGFRASHYPNGTAMSEYGSFSLMPVIGKDKIRAHERGSAYSHDKETATPYYYSIELDDYGIKGELTGVSSSGMLRFTYPEADDACLVIDNARSEYKNFFHVIPESNEIEGYITNAGRVGNQGYTGPGFACYFVAKLDKAFSSYAIVPEPEFAPNADLFEDGFEVEFYNNDFDGKAAARLSCPDLDYEWQGSPAPKVQEDRFCVRAKGTLKARKSGKHIFYVISDDKVKLYVNGEQVIDSKKTHRPFPDLYSKEMEAGESCEIMVEYFERSRLATLRFCCLEPESRTEEQLAKMAEDGSVASAVQVSFPTKAEEVVEIRLGTSFISLEQARKNLAKEIGRKSFDRIAREGKAVWDKNISRIRIESSEENKKI
nr:hypothetical protein [Bacteroidales bacterium]